MSRRSDCLFGAVEAGGTKFVCALGTADGIVHARATIPTGAPRETLEAVRTFFRANPPAAIGVASFGPIGTHPDAANYGVIGATPKPGWQGVDYRAELAGFGFPVHIDTDVNGAARAEARLGAGLGRADLAYVTVGTGIGVGVARAHGGRAPNLEIGHLPARRAPGDADFAGCCPFHDDCFEGLAAGPAVLKRWGKPLSALAMDHPAHALEARYLGELAACLVLAYKPDVIVFGGGVLRTPGLIDRIPQAMHAYLNGYAGHGAENAAGPRITLPGLGEDAGIVGGLMLASQA